MINPLRKYTVFNQLPKIYKLHCRANTLYAFLGKKTKQTKSKTNSNILVFHISSVSLAVETVQPFTFQNAIIADITLPPMGNYSLRRLGSHRSFSVVLDHWQVKVRHWGLGGPDDGLLPNKAPLAVRTDSSPMPRSNRQTHNSTKRPEPLLYILLSSEQCT